MEPKLDGFSLFLNQYGLLGTFVLAMMLGVGVLFWVFMRMSKELRDENAGKISKQADKIDNLTDELDEWKKDYFDLLREVSQKGVILTTSKLEIPQGGNNESSGTSKEITSLEERES